MSGDTKGGLRLVGHGLELCYLSKWKGDAEVAGDGAGGRGRGRGPGWPGGGPRGVQCEQVSSWHRTYLLIALLCHGSMWGGVM